MSDCRACRRCSRRACSSRPRSGETPPPRPRSNRRRTLPSSPLLLLQFECCRVDAVPQPGRLRSVGEDVAEMPAAVRAGDLGARHPQGGVGVLVDRSASRRRREGRPTATRVVLRLGAKELRATAGTAVAPVLEDVVVLPRERALRPLLPQHVVLLGSQFRAPLRLGLLNLRHHTPSIGVPSKCGNRRNHYATEGCSVSFGRPMRHLKEEPKMKETVILMRFLRQDPVGQRFGVGALVIAWLAIAWTSLAFAVAVPLVLAVSEVISRRREETAYAVDDLEDLY